MDIEIIKRELQEVKDSVAKLTIAVDKLTNICSRMNTHIDFVEDTYDNLKNPLNYVKSKIENIIGCDKLLTNDA